MSFPRKKCVTCEKVKSVNLFHNDSSRRDGHYRMCKVCKKEQDAKRFRKNREFILKRNNKYAQINDQLPRRKAQFKQIAKRMMAKYPEKWTARAKLRYAVEMGRVIKPNICVVVPCRETKLHGHHYLGYEGDNWQNVLWLCQKHHTEAHFNIKSLASKVEGGKGR